MGFSSQRILKSKYLAYRYFVSMYKNDSILTFDKIQMDALEKVNILTDEAKEICELNSIEKEMYESNVNLAINNLMEIVSPPKERFYSNFKLFGVKGKKKMPPVFVFSKQEVCMYILNKMNYNFIRRKYNKVDRMMTILDIDEISKLVNISMPDLFDEMTFAENQIGYSQNYKTISLYKALINCNKIELLVEYLVVYKKDDVLNCVDEGLRDYNNDTRFDPKMVTNDGKFYYIIPHQEQMLQMMELLK